MNRKFPICLLLGTLLASVLFSCRKNVDEGVEVLSNSVAITEFSLQADDGVIPHLDTVFFTIDLEKGLIYNADSLPVGTKVSGLRVKMVHTACSSCEFHVTGGTWMRDTTFEYRTEDSIDFTGDVKYTIVSMDKNNTKTYTMKVNVHQMEPDTLYWSEMARRDLPSFTTPLEQRTAQYNESLYCFIRDAKGYVMSVTSDPYANRWTKTRVTLPFTPDMTSFTATEDALYVLDENGALYTSADGLEWTACGTTFYSILGAYETTLLGVTKHGDVYKHAEYPVRESFVAEEIPAKFPIKGASQTVKLESQWAVSDQVIFFGGELPTGECTDLVWGYDGNVWGSISRLDTTIGYLKGATLFSYYATYFDSSDLKGFIEPTLLCVGGMLSDGTATKEMNMSIDNGLSWVLANENLHLPSYIAPFAYAQAFVVNKTYTDARSMGSDEWVQMQTKLPASLRANSRAIQPITSWDCPFVYLIGGVNEQGYLFDNIWRGVINRLMFKPTY